MTVVSSSFELWRLTGFYGIPKRGRRHESWALLKFLARVSNLPWVCTGDFNDLLFAVDKKGGNSHPESLLLRVFEMLWILVSRLICH